MVFSKERQQLFFAAGFIHPWVIGGYWTLPLQYIQNGIAINELTGGTRQLPSDLI